MGGAKRPTGKSGAQTLLMSVILSAPGPLVIGLGLLVGSSSTQLADFFRRTAELAAIICAFVIYRVTTDGDRCDKERKAHLEQNANRFIGAMMCAAGAIMAVLAFVASHADKGNVVPGLVIALLGAIVNGVFWARYTTLAKSEGNAILAAQARLYRAKTFVDTCVSIALLTVLAAPGTDLAIATDLVGSIIVSVYMIYGGIATIRDSGKGAETEAVSGNQLR